MGPNPTRRTGGPVVVTSRRITSCVTSFLSICSPFCPEDTRRVTPHGGRVPVPLLSGSVIPPNRSQPIPPMKSSTENQAQGTAKALAGKVKSTTGKLVGNPRLEAAGKSDQAEGRVQKKVGQIQRVLEK